MRRKCENHLAIGRGFCYYEKAVLADNREGGASTNGKMSVLRQGLELRHQSEPLSPPLEPHLETQCEARQGHRGRQTPARLRMHPLPPQRQGHPRCVNCNDCTEQGSPDWASLFRILGHSRRAGMRGAWCFPHNETAFKGSAGVRAVTKKTVAPVGAAVFHLPIFSWPAAAARGARRAAASAAAARARCPFPRRWPAAAAACRTRTPANSTRR